MRILLVEEHALLRKALVDILTPMLPAGTQLYEATCLTECVHILTLHPIHLVILDPNFADGNGLTSLRSLLKFFPQPYWVLLSDLDTAHYANLGEKIRDVLQKNLAPDTLISRLKQHLTRVQRDLVREDVGDDSNQTTAAQEAQNESLAQQLLRTQQTVQSSMVKPFTENITSSSHAVDTPQISVLPPTSAPIFSNATTRRLDPSHSESLSEHHLEQAVERVLGITLNPTEKAILPLIMRGASNQEIADHLGMSLTNVKNKVARMFALFHVHNRASLVSLVYNTLHIGA